MLARYGFVLALLFLVSSAWSAVTSEVSRTDYVGNGSVAAYSTTFPVKATSELRVFTQDADGQDVELTLGADYTAVLNATGLATVTLTAGNLTNGYKLSLQRGIPYTQTYNPAQSGAYNAASLGTALDRLAMEVIRLKGDVDRAIKIPYLEAGGDTATKLEDDAATRANQTLIFDSSGNASVGAVTSATASPFAQTLLDDTTANEARTTLGLPSQAMTARTVVANDTAGSANGTATLIDNLTVLADGSVSRRDLSARFADSFNVKDYGAVGDGNTDDTAAIQAAISAIPTTAGGTLPTLPATTAQGGYAVVLPRGVYKITAKLVVGARRMMFLGNGMIGSNGTIIYQTDANADFIDYYTSSLDGISVYGIQFYGAGKASGTGNAIRLGRAAQTAFSVHIQRCWFTAIPNACVYADYCADLSIQGSALENAKYGLYVANPGIAEGDIGKLQGCTLYGLTYGVYATAGSNLLISGNQINLCGTNPGGAMDSTSGGIVLIKGASPSVRATTISGNAFRGNVTDIIIDGSTGSAISSNTGVIDTNVSGNTSDRCYRRFILVDDADGTRIIGNTITAPNAEAGAFDAIDIADTSDGTIIDGNSISVVTGATPRYGLSLGTSTVNTALGSNLLMGSTGAISLGAAATFTTNIQMMHGTWTPTLGGAGTLGANTYTTQNGKWTRFGDLVWATCQVVMSVKDAAMAGGVSIRGLPFAAKSGDAPVSCAIGGFSRINLGPDEHLTARTSGSVTGGIDLIASNDAGGLSAIDTADLTASVEIDITVVYRPSGAAILSGTTVQ